MITLSSCHHYVKKCIDNDDYKYWYMQKGTRIQMYFFDNNGYWTILEKDMFSSLRKYRSDEILQERWKLTGSSSLEFDGCKYNILFVSNGILIIERNSEVQMLYNVPIDAIPQKFRRKGPFGFETGKKNNFWVKPGEKPFYWDV